MSSGDLVDLVLPVSATSEGWYTGPQRTSRKKALGDPRKGRFGTGTESG